MNNSNELKVIPMIKSCFWRSSAKMVRICVGDQQAAESSVDEGVMLPSHQL